MNNKIIKFKVWDKHLNKFIPFDSINKVDFNDESYNFLQYTGINDKNGIEIYEGDIVKIHRYDEKYENGEVLWAKEYFTYLIKCYNFDGGAYWSNYFHSFKQPDLRIIGNIFESPELTKNS